MFLHDLFWKSLDLALAPYLNNPWMKCGSPFLQAFSKAVLPSRFLDSRSKPFFIKSGIASTLPSPPFPQRKLYKHVLPLLFLIVGSANISHSWTWESLKHHDLQIRCLQVIESVLPDIKRLGVETVVKSKMLNCLKCMKDSEV